MSNNLLTVAYVAASILFILSLGGLSNQETARRGNVYGIAGMVVAIGATALNAQVTGYGVFTGVPSASHFNWGSVSLSGCNDRNAPARWSA